MKTHKLMRAIGIILIIAGVIIIAAAAAMHYSAEKRSSELVQAYMDYAEHITAVRETSAEPTTAQAQTGQNETQAQSAAAIPEGVMGVMVIDKIDMTAPIVEGTRIKNIQYALGHFEDTALPGDNGNFAVAGHRSYTFGEYFSRLDELVAGDTVKVIYGSVIYTYTVDETMVVEPESIEVLDPTANATITLVTCTPKWTATHRLIVKGTLTEVRAINE